MTYELIAPKIAHHPLHPRHVDDASLWEIWENHNSLRGREQVEEA